jgi:ABC-type branched-subunit amino acid transport system ATPase component
MRVLDPGIAADRLHLTCLDRSISAERAEVNALLGTNRAGRSSLLEVIAHNGKRMFRCTD